MDIAGKIIEELRRSAKIGEMQGETLRLDRAEQIIRRYLKGESCGECSRRKWYQAGYEDAKMNKDAEEWVLADDGLPEDGESVLITYRGISGTYHVDVDEYDSECGWSSGWDNDIIAWAELPEPYCGKE